MSAISSRQPEPAALIGWWVGVFCALMLVLMFAFPGEETIPFHLLFLALGLVYGFRMWSLWVVWSVIAVTTLASGFAMTLHWQQGHFEMAELVEVPLMPALLLAMVWHARRRAEAQRQMAAMGDERAANLLRQREFLRDACHAIRTPVTIARGHLDLAEVRVADTAAVEDLSVVRAQLDRMTRLSSRLLAMAELDQGDSLVVHPVDLAELLRSIGVQWSKSVDRNWQLDIRDTGEVRIAEDWIGQTVDALLENAVKATTVKDSIRISCWVSDGWAHVDVADSGPGIPESDRERVFDRFWHTPTADGQAGTGLGLSTVRSVVLAHGGATVVRTAPEGGALVHITLPAQLSRVSLAAQPPTEGKGATEESQPSTV
jgi:signal transduction histidine kinase